MTTPVEPLDDELIGSTRPEILALALSGHLAAAAGGENQHTLNEGVAAVEAALLHEDGTLNVPEVPEAPEVPPAPITPVVPVVPNTSGSDKIDSTF